MYNKLTPTIHDLALNSWAELCFTANADEFMCDGNKC